MEDVGVALPGDRVGPTCVYTPAVEKSGDGVRTQHRQGGAEGGAHAVTLLTLADGVDDVSLDATPSVLPQKEVGGTAGAKVPPEIVGAVDQGSVLLGRRHDAQGAVGHHPPDGGAAVDTRSGTVAVRPAEDAPSAAG